MTTRAPNMTPPQGVRDECATGVKWHEEGHSGDGLKPETVAWARRLANGEPISEDKVRKMRAWLARHETDKSGEGFRPGEDGYPSPGRVAWALWGGDPAVSWSAKLVDQLDAEAEGRSAGGPMTIQRAALFAATTKREERAGKSARFVASTANPARSDASVIDQASWKLDNYRANPVVLQDHDYEVENIVGRGSVAVEGGQLMLDVEWAPTPAGMICRDLYEGGFLNAVSVGFIPGRATRRSEMPRESPYYAENSWGMVYFDCQLLEVSMVAIGDDAAALAARAPAPEGVEVRGVTDLSDLASRVAADPAFARAVAAALTASGVSVTPKPAPSGSGESHAPTGGLSFLRKG